MSRKIKYCIAFIVCFLAGTTLYNYYSNRDIIHESYVSIQPTQIYLYGEYHGRKEILSKEFELWQKH